ncbi:MAG: MotA/TolQ/ExbB proton channel family protein [Dongiaceae bacterium]
MANTSIHYFFKRNRASADDGTAPETVVAGMIDRVQSDLADSADPSSSARATIGVASRPAGANLAYLSRCIVLQSIGVAFIVGLWIAGFAGKPFESQSSLLCWLIVGIAALGVFCVFLQRWSDVQWLATHVVRLGLLGTVIGLIISFSAARSGGSADPNEVRTMIASVVDGMYVSLYATLLGISTNLWLKINMRLLGRIDG